MLMTCLTGLASATFPDGSLPEVIDVVRIAANLFAAGQETTVRLLANALLLLAEEPDLQRRLRDDRDPHTAGPVGVSFLVRG